MTGRSRVDRRLRIAVGGIRYETNSFAGAAARPSVFEERHVRLGAAAVLDAERNTMIGGVASAADDLGVELVGLLDAYGGAGPPVPDDVYVDLRERLLDRLRAARDVDAIHLALHGAMATTEREDAEADLVASVRDVTGPSIPIAVSLDLHAAPTERLCSLADVVIGYKTCPHVDQAETGRLAARLLGDIARGHRRWSSRRRVVPMLTASEAHDTNTGALAEHMRVALSAVGGCIGDVSIFACQPWLDTSRTGWSITCTFDACDPDGPGAADAALATIADGLMRDVARFTVAKLQPAAAVRQAESALAAGAPAPVLLADSGDSPSAGAPGDGVDLLRALQQVAGRRRCLAIVTDDGAVAACQKVGVGGSVSLDVGARHTPSLTKRARIEGVVRALDRGRHTRVWPPGHVDLGGVAVVRSGQLDLVITARPAAMLDPSLFEHLRLDLATYELIQVKSAGGYRAGWERVSRTAVVVGTEGASSSALATLPFSRTSRQLWPFRQAAAGIEVEPESSEGASC